MMVIRLGCFSTAHNKAIMWWCKQLMMIVGAQNQQVDTTKKKRTIWNLNTFCICTFIQTCVQLVTWCDATSESCDTRCYRMTSIATDNPLWTSSDIVTDASDIGYIRKLAGWPRRHKSCTCKITQSDVIITKLSTLKTIKNCNYSLASVKCATELFIVIMQSHTLRTQ